ncbi:TPA: hypothetical protein UMT89_002733 [Stenotrophomonas maltophilia]|nr:hypothetical protein [Stenotrophomonas maltophilia]
MTDTQSSPSTEVNAVFKLWLQQLADSFSWAEKHPVKLAAASIALPSLSLSYYLQSEHIPLSILSSDVISGLPSLLVMICAITLMLFALALMPLMVMFEEADASNDGSLHVLKRSSERGLNIFQWLTALILPGAILAIAVVLMATHPGNDKWGIPVSIALAGLVFVFATFFFNGNKKKRHWLDRTWSAISSNLVQMIFALFVMKGAMEYFREIENSWVILGLLLLVMAAATLMQVFFVRLIELGSKDGKIIARTFHASLIIITTICIFPTTGGWLAGKVISSSGSGGISCSRLIVTGEKSDFAEVIDWRDKTRPITKELGIRAATSSMYYVRLKSDTKGIATIPVDRVANFVECSSASEASKASSPPGA